MMNMTKSRRRGRIGGGLALMAMLTFTGCDLESLLEVNDPDTVNPGTLEDPAVIDVVIAGAQGDFTDAFSGGESYVTVSALLADEFFSSGSFPTRTATDQRVQFRPVEGNTSDETYRSIHFARRALDEAAERVAAHEDLGTGSDEYQELKSLEGYSLVLLAEGFCSHMPISETVDGVFTYGAPMTSAGVFGEAVQRFDAALAGGEDDLAAVGKARAMLALAQSPADYAAAAAVVADVPTDFTYFIYHSQSGTSNPLFTLQGNGRYSQSSNEGINGLPFRNGDPRTPWVEDPEGGFTPSIPLYLSLKATDYDSPIVFASGVEARLIQAEALMEAGDFAGMTGILNDLRADVADIMAAWVDDYTEFVPDASLPALTAPTNREDAIDQLFYERGFWLYLTGHRLGDLRRLVYQKGRPTESVYPTGVYHKSGNYGDDVVFPLDFDEVVNDQFEHEGCNVDNPAIR